MSTEDTSSAGFFEDKYQTKSDPWNFASDQQELQRYESIISALSHRRYRSAFEPGCSVGVLTEKLAEYCDAVEAIDFSETAVRQARSRCAHLKSVFIHCQSLLERLPVISFDLLVLSEIGYYFNPDEWRDVSTHLIGTMEPGTFILAAHWLGVSADHKMGGDQVHEILLSDKRLFLEHAERHQSFRLDRMVRL